MQTYSAVTAEIARLQARAEQLRKSEIAGVIGRIREAIEAYGITAADLGLVPGSKARPAKSAQPVAKGIQTGVAKYRDPKSGKTWTGRGKPPAWIAGVRDRDAFLISGDAMVQAPAPAATAKRGRSKAKAVASTVGVPKYRDPASGKTWTGRGKPPLWIAGAKNRDSFLISASAAPNASAA